MSLLSSSASRSIGLLLWPGSVACFAIGVAFAATYRAYAKRITAAMAACVLLSLAVYGPPAAPHDRSFYVNAWQSWGFTGTLVGPARIPRFMVPTQVRGRAQGRG